MMLKDELYVTLVHWHGEKYLFLFYDKLTI